MIVTTQSEEIEKAQRAMVNFVANHPLDCPCLRPRGECELQEVIFDWAMSKSGLPRTRIVSRKISVADDRQRPAALHSMQTLHTSLRRMDGRGRYRAGNRGVNTSSAPMADGLIVHSAATVSSLPHRNAARRSLSHETRPWELDQTVSTMFTAQTGCSCRSDRAAGVCTAS